MARWLTYLRERFPLPVYLLLAGGMSFSGTLLLSNRVHWRATLGSLIGILLFFFELRLMDELKDHEKDKVAHPERPLPRGLLDAGEVRRAIDGGLAAMALLAVIYALVFNLAAGALYLFVAFYLFLMFKEFFVGEELGARPFLYALTHQIVIYPLLALPASCLRAANAVAAPTLWFGTAVFGTFFTYEVCRKLDPGAHPILKTYLRVYGPKRTAAMAAGLTLIAMAGSSGLRMPALLWPFSVLLLAGLPLVWLRPKQHKLVEGLATLALLGHLWMVVLATLLRGRG